MNPCGCGCGQLVRRRFVHGHNARLQAPREPIKFNGARWYIECRDGTKYLWARAVVWNELGVRPQRDQDVHHINEIPTDDRPENLVLLSRREHMLAHLAAGTRYRLTDEDRRRANEPRKRQVTRPCEACGAPVTRMASQISARHIFCGRSCMYGWRVGRTIRGELKDAEWQEMLREHRETGA